MTKAEMQARIEELVRQVNKETDRADKAEQKLKELIDKTTPRLMTLSEMEAEDPNVFKNKD